MDTIGGRISNLRKARQISQEQLAFELGVSTQTIHNWEKNKSDPSVKNIETLCQFFSVSPNYFFPQLNSEADPPPAETSAASNPQSSANAKAKKKSGIYLFAACISYLSAVICAAASVCIGLILFSLNDGYDSISTINVNHTEFAAAIAFTVIFIAASIAFTILCKKNKSFFKRI